MGFYVAVEVNIGGDGSLFVGEDKVFKLEVVDTANVPVNIAAWSVLFDVRKTIIAADPAIFSITATVVGTYNSVRASNTQRAQVTLTDTQLNTVKAIAYKHSWKRMDDGSETVLAFGTFTPQKATAP